MAQNKSLTDFFGPSATQDETQLIIKKDELKSQRTPAAYISVTPSTSTSGEATLTEFLLAAWERQDTSVDAQFAIFGPEITLVPVRVDGLDLPHQQFIFTVRILNPIGVPMPNPNLI